MIEKNKELQRKPESEDTAEHVARSEKKCTYCNTPMPVDAHVCASCNRDQRWYLNYFRGGDLLLLVSILISFGMVYFSYRNFHESREERVKASEALERASKAEDLVKQGQQQLEQLQAASSEARIEVDRITSLVKDAETKLTKVQGDITSLSQIADYAMQMRVGLRSGLIHLLELQQTASSEVVRMRAKSLIETIGSDYETRFKATLQQYEIQNFVQAPGLFGLYKLTDARNVPALVKVIESDSDLSHMAFAFFALREATGYPFRMFDIEGVKRWCGEHKNECSK